jgi:hypothetical protein
MAMGLSFKKIVGLRPTDINPQEKAPADFHDGSWH